MAKSKKAVYAAIVGNLAIAVMKFAAINSAPCGSLNLWSSGSRPVSPVTESDGPDEVACPPQPEGCAAALESEPDDAKPAAAKKASSKS